jgi:hypothetical protein
MLLFTLGGYSTLNFSLVAGDKNDKKISSLTVIRGQSHLVEIRVAYNQTEE